MVTDEAKNVAQDLMEVLGKHAKRDDGSYYVNPNALVAITNVLYEYWDVEDEAVEDWIASMWQK